MASNNVHQQRSVNSHSDYNMTNNEKEASMEDGKKLVENVFY